MLVGIVSMAACKFVIIQTHHQCLLILSETQTIDGFLLSRQWRDLRDGLELSFWASTAHGPLRLHVPSQRAVCFVSREERRISMPDNVQRKELALSLPEGAAVDAIYTFHQSQLAQLRADYPGLLHESDIKPHDRYLMERFINAGFSATGVVERCDGYLQMAHPKLKPKNVGVLLKLASIDIETRGLTGRLYSIAIHSDDTSVVLMVAAGSPPRTEGYELRFCETETLLLQEFFNLLQRLDPDVLIGWNVVNFDLDVIARKCRQLGVPLALGRAGEASAILQPGSNGQFRIARIPGRAVLDGVDTLKSAFWSFESFSLENVSQELLGRGKTIAVTDKVARIDHLYNSDKAALAHYNIEDCRLVTEIFKKADLINFAVQRAVMTGLPIDKTGGAVQTFDNLYLPRLHRKGYVAPAARADETRHSPGGYVLDSEPGLYRNVIVLDFKSLYPSIIRTFLIDPLGLARGISRNPETLMADATVPGFDGACFSRQEHILPGLIKELWRKRDEAKAENNSALSQAIKIIMNSLYGVLGSNGCRFHHYQLASSITRRGHEIIQTSQKQIEIAGYRVIYGDTDSLFVWLGDSVSADQADAIGNQLQCDLNDYWKSELQQKYSLPSHLEVEYETHYHRFVMPTIRGSESGSKKRYAGLVVSDNNQSEVIFKGLEAVRTDWTPLAREFQRCLYSKVFNDEPVEALIKNTVAQLLAGELDNKLVYKKRLRRKLADYTKNVPPHVQAARKHSNPQSWINYVITVNGPEPSDERHSAIDYQHYMDKQLEPVTDGILHFLDSSFQSVTSAQIELF